MKKITYLLVLLICCLCFGFTAEDITSDIENGNFNVTDVTGNAVTGDIQRTNWNGEGEDEEGQYNYWFYFQIDSEDVAGETISVTVSNQEYDMYPVYRTYSASAWSAWSRCTTTVGADDTFAQLLPSGISKVEFAWTFPIKYSEKQEYVNSIANNDFVSVTNGTSVQGRNIPLLTITNTDVPAANKKVVWLTTSIHPGENHCALICWGVVKQLVSTSGSYYRDKYIFKILPMINPDGLYLGTGRCSSVEHLDLNRDFDEATPQSETQFVIDSLDDWLEAGNRLDLHIDFHDSASHLFYKIPLANLGYNVDALTDSAISAIANSSNFWTPSSTVTENNITGASFWYFGTQNNLVTISAEFDFSYAGITSILESDLDDEGINILRAIDNFLSSDSAVIDLESNLVAYYKFNEGSYDGSADEVIDSSGNGHHGTLVERSESGGYGFSNTTDQKLGAACIEFTKDAGGDDDNSGEAVVIASDDDFNPGTADMSFNVWANPSGETQDTEGTVFAKYGWDSQTNMYVLDVYAYDWLAKFRDGDGDYLSVQKDDNTGDDAGWVMLTVIKESSTLKLFKNGILQGVDYDTDVGSITNTEPFTIGRFFEYDSFSGLIDNLGVFNKALTHAEIMYLFTGGDGTEDIFDIPESFEHTPDTYLDYRR